MVKHGIVLPYSFYDWVFKGMDDVRYYRKVFCDIIHTKRKKVGQTDCC